MKQKDQDSTSASTESEPVSAPEKDAQAEQAARQTTAPSAQTTAPSAQTTAPSAQAALAEQTSRTTHSSRSRCLWNLCDLPPWQLASVEFSDDPQPIEIQGVRRANRFLFERLDDLTDPVERATVFNEYMSVKFHLHESSEGHTRWASRSIRNSYLRFLRGWGVDSNSVEAAVLKGWVESRIGIAPTFHRGKVLGDDPEDQMAYVTDRMKGSAHTNAITSQLDVLFAFCQYELHRRLPGEKWVQLYRGTYDADQYETLHVTSRRERVVRLNNLCSFTSEEERSWEFGSTVWQVKVPVAKVFFFSRLLPESILKGEEEYLVIGGEYRVRTVG